MITLPTTEHETRRVEMVRSFGLIDQPRPAQHDEISALARDLSGARWGLVTLVEAERVWISGAVDYPVRETCRWDSFCTHVIAEPDRITWIADASQDFRVNRLPSVVDDPHLRFYAGAPILVNGHPVGSVCVFDPKPRPYDPTLAQSLTRLAAVVGEDLAARHRERALHSALIASADALIECDDGGIITAWSQGACDLFGFTTVEALGSNIDIIIPSEKKALHHHAFEQWRLRGEARVGRRLELRARCKDDSEIDVELWMSVAQVRGVAHIHAHIRDISVRTAQAAALRRAIDEAEAANAAKTIFLTNMSHELRTPLNGVIGVADVLSQTQLSDHQRELTSIIQSSSHQLRRLIGDILDLARIEAGQLVLSPAPLALAELVEDVAAVSRVVADEKAIDLLTDLGPGLDVHVMADPLRLRQVLTNLVANAVKFTEAGSVILRVSQDGGLYKFEVTDTGIGFDAEQKAAIFGRFQQADGTITRRFGGSGLGLAICSELVGAMGGDLDCHSTVGQGSTFWLTLPLATVCPLAAPDKNAAAPNLLPKRVLVVDDNPTNRRVADLILQTGGVAVTCVDDGRQAIEAFLSSEFDAILMDMMMPVMDGLTATRAIRDVERQQGLTRTPIIMLTANSLPQHIDASLEAGADMHLPKPMTPAALFLALAEVQRTYPPEKACVTSGR